MSAPPAGHKVLMNPVTGIHLRIIRSGADTAGTLLEMEATYPPSSAAPPLHFHPRQDERFVILEGGMRAIIGGRACELRVGDTLDVPAGVPHAMWNAGSGSSTVNWQTRPALRTEQFFETVFTLAERGQVDSNGTPRLLDLAVLVPAYWQEIRMIRPSPFIQRLLFAVLGPIAALLGHRARPAPS